MNREDIIRMALEAGGEPYGENDKYIDIDTVQLQQMIEKAVAAEREACAKRFDGSDYMMYRSEVAAAIRARNNAE
jgi:hypothetical protein